MPPLVFWGPRRGQQASEVQREDKSEAERPCGCLLHLPPCPSSGWSPHVLSGTCLKAVLLSVQIGGWVAVRNGLPLLLHWCWQNGVPSIALKDHSFTPFLPPSFPYQIFAGSLLCPGALMYAGRREPASRQEALPSLSCFLVEGDRQ